MTAKEARESANNILLKDNSDRIIERIINAARCGKTSIQVDPDWMTTPTAKRLRELGYYLHEDSVPDWTAPKNRRVFWVVTW